MPLNHIKALPVVIDWQSIVPPYAQIVGQINCMAIAGQLSEGDLLPQIRVLATQLDANPNTVARAYNELARLGVLRKRQGSGCFVTQPAPGRRAESRLASLRSRIQELVVDAQKLGLTLDQLVAEMGRQYPPAREWTGTKPRSSSGTKPRAAEDPPPGSPIPAAPSLWSPTDSFVD